MARLFKKPLKNVGLPPGTILKDSQIYPESLMTVFDYGENIFQEKKVSEIKQTFPFKDSSTTTWINLEGINPEIIKTLAEHYGIHPLVSEDIVSISQRPKIEEYDNYLFMVFKMIYFSDKAHEIVDEQISLIIGQNFVISIQEREGDVFDNIRERIRQQKGRIRQMKADYLAYALLDAVVDNYYLILEKKGEEIEKLEEEVLLNPNHDIGIRIHKLKRDMIYLKKQIWPLREVIIKFRNNESHLIEPPTEFYLRDVYDHTIQIIDTIESFRDLLFGLHDSYLSAISNKMNEVMKVLTIFAAIFIPLTFLAGIYGMNFENMPELKWPYGYFIVLGTMASMVILMLFYFKKKRWL